MIFVNSRDTTVFTITLDTTIFVNVQVSSGPQHAGNQRYLDIIPAIRISLRTMQSRDPTIEAPSRMIIDLSVVRAKSPRAMILPLNVSRHRQSWSSRHYFDARAIVPLLASLKSSFSLYLRNRILAFHNFWSEVRF